MGIGAATPRRALAALRRLYSSKTSRQKLELGAAIFGAAKPRLEVGILAAATAALPLSSNGVCPVSIISSSQPSGPPSSVSGRRALRLVSLIGTSLSAAPLRVRLAVRRGADAGWLSRGVEDRACAPVVRPLALFRDLVP